MIHSENFEAWSERKRRTHDASASEPSRYTLRARVRDRARTFGKPVPGWAKTRSRGARELHDPLTPAREKTTRTRRVPERAASHTSRKLVPPFDRALRDGMNASGVSVAPAEIPPELSAWRERAGLGACVGIDHRGRVLLAEAGSVRRFASVAEAVQAVGPARLTLKVA
jgi:hypothetical protein